MIVEVVEALQRIGVRAFTTTRMAGSFAWHSEEPSRAVMERWEALRVFAGAERLASAHQVHGDRVLMHGSGWRGLLREIDADGHCSVVPGTAMTVTLADCVPVFLAHPSGAVAIAHSGWRGTVANIAVRALEALLATGVPADEVVAHCGPAICGTCYVVGPEVYRELTGAVVREPAPVDLRAIIGGQLACRGVQDVTVSKWCTRCDNSRFFSHRRGDDGRQLGVIVTGAG